jgi:virulence-associated protein VapD
MKHSGEIGGMEQLCHVQSVNAKGNLSVTEDYIVDPKVQVNDRVKYILHRFGHMCYQSDVYLHNRTLEVFH